MRNSTQHYCQPAHLPYWEEEKTHSCINKGILMDKTDRTDLSIYVVSGVIGMACKVCPNTPTMAACKWTDEEYSSGSVHVAG